MPGRGALMAALRYMSGRELETRRSQRLDKLEWIAHQVESGELVIRQATAEERARYGIRVGAATRGAPAGGRRAHASAKAAARAESRLP